nr:cationic peroxidase 1-like [Ipomoea batatas]
MSSAQLSKNFYETSCPEALSIIKLSVHSTVQTEPRMGASLLRLHFFDCFINASPLSILLERLLALGCDGSILLDDTANFTGEKSADPIRGSIRGYDVIDNIKAQLENSCPDVVSCADILTVVARDSVVELGGPSWKVLLGRRDSTTASLSDANMDIPGPASNLSQLISAFSKKGFSVKEMVALAGLFSYV